MWYLYGALIEPFTKQSAGCLGFIQFACFAFLFGMAIALTILVVGLHFG